MKWLIILMFLLFTTLVGATVFNAVYVPSTYSTFTSTGINFSMAVNQSAGVEDYTWNISIWNKSSSDGSYSRLFDGIIKNNTFWNKTVTLKDNDRHWVYMSVANVSGGAVNSSTRIIDIDTNYYNLEIGNFGKVNISLDTGRIDTSYGVRIGGELSSVDCGASTRGLIIYNATNGFIGCTGNGWKSLNSTLA